MTKQEEKKYKNPGYELTDASFKPVVLSVIGFFLIVILAMIAMAGLFSSYRTTAQNKEVAISPLAGERQLPPAPRLQVKPELDWEVFNAKQDSLLNSPPSWLLKEANQVRIPIDLAKELALKRGFQVRSKPEK